MKFDDIQQFTRSASYKADHPWRFIFEWIKEWQEPGTKIARLNLDPDFQRAHVWDEVKQRRYVEYILRGGKSSRTLYFNHPNWMNSFKGDFVLVDGKQRLEAVRKFMSNELAIFDGHKLEDFEDTIPYDASFEVHINDLKTRAEVLQWYLDLNSGGVVHTPEELAIVRKLLEAENGKT